MINLQEVAVSLLEMAARSTNPRLSRKLLSGLQVLIPPASAWDNSTLSPELNKLLGELAIEDSDVGDQAARLVGHLHSRPAVNFILNKADDDRLIPALLEIQQSAGTPAVFCAGEYPPKSDFGMDHPKVNDSASPVVWCLYAGPGRVPLWELALRCI